MGGLFEEMVMRIRALFSVQREPPAGGVTDGLSEPPRIPVRQ
jgi:hypothetical protein